MKKNKLLAILMSGAMVATFAGGAVIGANNNSHKSTQNNVLLVAPSQSQHGCVINGNGQLVLTNKEGKIISYISVGEMLNIHSENGNTMYVTVEETGATGYINTSNVLNITNGNINDVVRMNRNGYIINVDSNVNIRKAPGMDSSIVGKLTNNSIVKITGKTGNWYRVSVNGVKGYIFDEYVGESTINQSATTTTNNVINTTPVITTNSGVSASGIASSNGAVANANASASATNILGTASASAKASAISVSGTATANAKASATLNGSQTIKPENNKPATKPVVKPENNKPATKPVVKPENNKPATKPVVKPENNKPATKPVVKPENNKPATKPVVKPENNKPATKPVVKPENNTPATKPVVKPENNTPATKPVVKPENNKPATKPVVKPENNKPATKPVVKPENNTPATKPVVKPENNTPATKPVVKPENNKPATKPVVKPENNTPATKPVVKPENNKPATKPVVKPENNNGSNTTVNNVNYNMPMSKYIGGEIKEYEASIGTNKLTAQQVQNLTNAINPNDIKDMYEFLNVGTYRGVNEQAMENVLASNGVLAGQAQAFLNAAKEYNLDPVYLMSQCMFETGHGTSNFAKGITITQYENSNKQMVKLANPVTVYNLFGIGADNSNPTVGATSYAYLHGWTSIPKAIQGAAQFLHNDYVDNQIKQQTPYELRYINGTIGDMWHQYSTNINYAKVLGQLISQYKYLYNSNDQFEFNVPKFEAPQPQQMVALNEILPNTK